MSLRFLIPQMPRMQCSPLLYCITSPSDPVSISFSLSFILLLRKQCLWHLVWWVMSLPDACSCLFGYFIGPDDSLFPLHTPHWLPQKPAGPDWSNMDDLRVRMHHSRPASTGESPLKPADPLSLNKVPAMCSFVILWPFNDIPFKHNETICEIDFEMSWCRQHCLCRWLIVCLEWKSHQLL